MVGRAGSMAAGRTNTAVAERVGGLPDATTVAGISHAATTDSGDPHGITRRSRTLVVWCPDWPAVAAARQAGRPASDPVAVFHAKPGASLHRSRPGLRGCRSACGAGTPSPDVRSC